MDLDYFSDVLRRSAFADGLDGVRAVAVAVSGGADSMALLCLLADWARGTDVVVHALTVDHGLRVEAAAEAAQVAAWCADLGVSHAVLRWDADKPEAAVQEQARAARYGLMAGYCADHGVEALFLGHHRDDQAETVLFRLAKGSGLKGLGGMRAVQDRDGLLLMRPLLEVDKVDLVALCAARGQGFVDDPSNLDENYARVRLRKAADVLAEEGLTAKRLGVTAARLSRADEALDVLAVRAFDDVVNLESNRIVFKLLRWREQPEEIALRLLLRGFSHLRGGQDYLPRMEKIESLCTDLLCGESFRKRTLGSLIFERDDARGEIVIIRE